MSDNELIYSVKFPSAKEVFEALENDEEDDAEETAIRNYSGIEAIQRMEENTKYVLNKEKERDKYGFIKAVKDLAEYLEVDTEIYKEKYGYSARINVRCVMIGEGRSKIMIIKAFFAADSVQIITAGRNEEYDLSILLDYYTYDRYFKGKKQNMF